MKIIDERKNPSEDSSIRMLLNRDGQVIDFSHGTIRKGEKLEIIKGHPHELFLVDDKQGDSNGI